MDRRELSGFEVVVLMGGATVALGGCVVWLGAALAALLSGHLLGASFVDALRAASAFHSGVLTDPASAWPEPARTNLPGPWLYWGSTAAVAAALAIVGALALRRWGGSRVGMVRRRPLGVDGKARFARRGDLAPLAVSRAEPGRFILGRVGRRFVATEARDPGLRRRVRGRRVGDMGAVALIGPSRSGKTAAAVSGILEWDGPAVLSSVKTDLLGATHGWRADKGAVAVYDPTGTTGIRSASWSPLRATGTTLGAQRAARSLCDAAPRGGVEGGLDFWLVQAEVLLSGLLFVAWHGKKDMATVASWVMTQDRPGEHGPGEVRTILDLLLNDEDDEVVGGALDASRALLSMWEMEERTRSSIYATAQTVVWPWADPGVAAASRGRSVDLDWLLSGTNTLYLSAPIEDQARLAPAFGGLLNDLIKQAYLKVALNGRPLDPPLLVLIDEAGNTPLRALPEYASTLAGIGVLLVTVWQSVAQIEATYARQADTILTNHLSKLFYAGLSDPASLRYVGRVLGDTEVETRSRNVRGGGGGASVNVGAGRVPLAPPHALREMRPGDALLMHATLPPAHLHTHPYYQDRRLRARAALAPTAPTGPADPKRAPARVA